MFAGGGACGERDMPIYSYECKNAHQFDKLRPIADADKRLKCPDCAGGTKRTIALSFDQNPSKTKAHRGRIRQRFTNW
jgi:putative FmdB family regulatory protein